MEANQYVQHHIDFARRNLDNNQVTFTMVTLQGAGGDEPNQWHGIASYASGNLRADGKPRLLGRMSQLFSDRAAGAQPFDVNQADDLEVEISADGASVAITLVNPTWGGSQTLADVHHYGGVLVGRGGTIGNQTDEAVYLVSLGQQYVPG